VVALDEQGKPTTVPELVLETDEDVRRNKEANDRRRRRLADAAKEKRGRKTR
jgi:acyl-CoA hydrolase